MTFHRMTLILLYLCTLLVFISLIYTGIDYYQSSIVSRPHHELHDSYKPSGNIGHGLGVIGSSLMLILLLYSARKRVKFLRNAGNIRFWLNYHIWMGVTGPLLVIFHTAFKFGGIVAISFWSMVAVALSGVLGRYIYIQIPRTKTGALMSEADLEKQDVEFRDSLIHEFEIPEDFVRKMNDMSNPEKIGKYNNFSSLIHLLVDDLLMPLKLNALKNELRKKFGIDSSRLREAMRISRRRALLYRRMGFLKTAHKLLHHWHVIHRPFAIVMLIIMVVHVFITILFGYRWIF